MNILLLNQDWFAPELKSMGHNVVSCGMEENLDVVLEGVPVSLPYLLSILPRGFTPDVIVWNDNSSPFAIVGAEESTIPIVCLSIDTHHHSKWHKYLGHVCDRTLVGQRDYIPEFLEVGVSPVWFPLWSSRYVEPTEKREHGACFVGTFNKDLNPQRVEFFDRLKEKVPIYLTTGRWWEIFTKSEIVINQTVKGDLNFRVFEAMMCGPLLLTERTGNGLLDLFKEGEHLVCYAKGDVDEAAYAISKYLADLPGARRIAASGRALVAAKHSPEARARDLLSIITGLKRSSSLRRYFSAAVIYSVAGRSLRKVAAGAALPLFESALKCAFQALERSEEVDAVVETEVIYSCLEKDAMTRQGIGQALLYSLSEKYEAQTFFSLAAIRGLLNEGKRRDAEEISKKRFDLPQVEVFRIAEETITNILESGHKES